MSEERRALSADRAPLLAVVAFVVIVVFGYGWYAANEGLAPFGPSDSTWTGVFLTNGQAYFGHYYDAPGEYVQLREVHYLLSSGAQTGQAQPGQPQATPQVSLNRLGSEIHGPRSDMKISKAQILFIEELRPDSGLVAAILALRNAPPPTPAPATTAPTAAPSAPPATPSGSARPSPSPSPAR